MRPAKVVMCAGQWAEASRQRELLLAYLQQQTGAGTMLDTRRTRDYDADNLVDQYLNLLDVQVTAELGPAFIVFFVQHTVRHAHNTASCNDGGLVDQSLELHFEAPGSDCLQAVLHGLKLV